MINDVDWCYLLHTMWKNGVAMLCGGLLNVIMDYRLIWCILILNAMLIMELINRVDIDDWRWYWCLWVDIAMNDMDMNVMMS